MSNSLRSHGLQHTRVPHPSPTLAACSNSCPSSQWCHATISSSVIPFSSCLQSVPESGSFPMSQFFTSGGQSIGVSASASVLPMNIQDWFPSGLTGLISLQSKGLSRVFFNTTFKRINYLMLSLLYGPTLTSIHNCWKNHSIDYMTSWNQDRWEKYQQPQICRCHSNGRKWRGTKKPVDEDEKGEWKSWLKIQHSKN